MLWGCGHVARARDEISSKTLLERISLQAARAGDEISSKTHHLSGMSAAVITTII